VFLLAAVQIFAVVNMPDPSSIETTKKRKGTGRKPGRPYRRLAMDVLALRKDTVHKKIQVLLARKTLLEDRLQAYEQEVVARSSDVQEDRT
jgi:hypothetical protein